MPTSYRGTLAKVARQAKCVFFGVKEYGYAVAGWGTVCFDDGVDDLGTEFATRKAAHFVNFSWRLAHVTCDCGYIVIIDSTKIGV